MADKIEIRRGVWRFEWDGGRLADIFHAESDTPVDCMQAGEYDWNKGEAHVTEESLNAAADEWMREHGEEYTREFPYLMGGS